MKINLRILFFLLVLTFNWICYAQSWTNPYNEKVDFTLVKLKVKDSLFLESLNSLILDSECVKNKEEIYKYFFLFFSKDEVGYSVRVELLRLPVGDEQLFGIFYFNSYCFFVDGTPPPDLFKVLSTKEAFSYKKGMIPIIEEFANWNFVYNDGKLILQKHTCF